MKLKVQREEKAYWNKDVSRILEIGESTVRKWCLELEKNGYNFIRGHKDSRAFLQHDLNALAYFKDLTKVGNYSLEQAAKLVVERYKDRGGTDITASVPGENELPNRSLQEIENSLKELVELSKEHIDLNRTLLKKLEERDSIIESQSLYIKRMNEETATLQLQESKHVYAIEEEEEAKKKRTIERIKNFFKK